LVLNRQSMFGKESNSWCISKNGENIAESWTRVPKLIDATQSLLEPIAVDLLHAGCYITCDDYPEVVKKWDSKQTLFYFDPPYENVEDEFYHVNKRDGFDHNKLAEVVAGIQGSSVISYYESDSIKKLYPGFEVKAKEVNKHMQIQDKKDKAVEILLIKDNGHYVS